MVDNNFNLLRLAFALMVAVYHVVALSNVPAWKGVEAPLSLLAEIGVQGFFVLSGYLVFASLERSSSLTLYAEKRVRRLYPAYAMVVVVCASAALVMSPAARADIGAVARYLGWNLTFLNFLEPNLPGIFEANRFSEINGALWTLKVEVAFYLLLPMLAFLFRKTGWARWILVVAIYAGAEAWRGWLPAMGGPDHSGAMVELARQLPGQMSFFVTGIAFRMLNLGGWKLLAVGLAGAALFAISIVLPEAAFVRAIGLGAVAIWVARGLPRLFEAARFGDLSYGLYIVHFPVIQTVAAAGLFATPLVGAGVAALAALIAALLLWHMVEKPALRADSAYRKHA
jgi:peptidoglycan/LPS O-acetylase OafA/YrhL